MKKQSKIERVLKGANNLSLTTQQTIVGTTGLLGMGMIVEGQLTESFEHLILGTITAYGIGYLGFRTKKSMDYSETNNHKTYVMIRKPNLNEKNEKNRKKQ